MAKSRRAKTCAAIAGLRDGKAWGRPVDVQVASDGSLLVSDDKANAIYRIRYAP